ncbi:MAG: hypothetical protein KJ607_05200 [Bacteroidetes bacterium]|nr:hypothetical protein [Bacteroidota bacterium]
MNKYLIIFIAFTFFSAHRQISQISAQNVDLQIIELKEINSDYDDFGPQLMDSSTVIFTSGRRNDACERVVEYSHNLYTVKKDVWASPVKCPYLFNFDNHDACAGSSLDQNTLFFYKIFNNGDVYYSEKNKDGRWKSLKRLKLNSEYHECAATRSGDSLYFVSDRPGGKGMHDIYMTIKDGLSQKTMNVSELNSEADENHVFFTSDGKTLYFSSDRNGKNGFDVYLAKLGADGKWSEPEALPEPVNSSYNDISYIKTGVLSAMFASDRPAATKGYNLYLVDEIREKDTISDIPVILFDESPVETTGEGRILQLKYSVRLKGPASLMPDTFRVDRSPMQDSADMVAVHDFTWDSLLTLLDDPGDMVTGIEFYSRDTIVQETERKIELKESYTLDELKDAIDFDINYCKVQVGAFINILSVREFESKFPLLKGRVEMEEFTELNKFYMKETCKELDCAAALQKKCLTEYKSVDDTFIGVYSTEGERILIYFDVEKNIYVVVKVNR